ncbi:hypothetical protein VTP01DRAFT_1945 [Rhizomucor pusillus]|uniref:uncharacterized protein n=1 Tax=Rhizomucor pusillus TaxID=4840 RepID=UPI003742DBF7
MKVQIKSMCLAAYWRWDVQEADKCTICQQAYEHACNQCIMPGDDCALLTGSCGHTFHIHCIEEWIRTSENCPLCRKLWDIARDGP